MPVPSPVLPQMGYPGVPSASDASWESPFGIFGAYAIEYPSFQRRMGFSNQAYWDWVDGHFEKLGAHWTRSNLQLIWDIVEPVIGNGYVWNNQMQSDSVVRRVSSSPTRVHWVGVFHEGGGMRSDRPALRLPMSYPSEYARFVRDAVERYDGDGKDDLPGASVKYWQVGNEYPFLERAGRTMADYLAWARLTSSAIKEADPDARVMLIAATQGLRVEPWLETAIRELAPSRVIDAIDIHHWGKARDWQMTALPSARALLDALGRQDAQIFSCEHGTWAGNPAGEPVQTEEEQAVSLVKRYVFNLASGLDKLFWNNLMEWDQFGGNPGSIFNSMGLVSDGQYSGDAPDRFNQPRLAYWSYYLLSQHLGNDIRLGKRVDAGSPDIFVFRYPGGGGRGLRFVAWSEKGQAVVKIREPGFSGVAFKLVQAGPEPAGRFGVRAGVDGVFEMAVDGVPVLVESQR